MVKTDLRKFADANVLPSYLWKGLIPVFVPKSLRKCVLFLGIKKDGVFYPRGTAFLVSHKQSHYAFGYLVTAEHVVSGLLTKGHDIYVRINRTEGDPIEHRIDPSHWFYHPDDGDKTDVAICAFGNEKEDKLEITSVPLIDGQLATREMMDDYAIGPGDEVAIIGLFRSHYGREKNIPVVRIGNLSMMNDERIKTTYCGFIQAYLIEARSIGGLSGSPVFLSLQPERLLGGPKKRNVDKPYWLLGLMHGHFDIKDLNLDVVTDTDTEAAGTINSGMGVVVPIEKILETINQPDLAKIREGLVAKWLAEDGAKPDADDEDDPAAHANVRAPN